MGIRYQTGGTDSGGTTGVPNEGGKKPKKTLAWVFCAILACCALGGFPSFASILFLFTALLILPVDKVQDFFRQKGLQGAVKTGLIVVLLLAAGLTSPSQDTRAPEVDDSTAVLASAESAETGIPENTETASAVKSIPEPDQTVTADPEPASEPEATANPEPTPEPGAAVEPETIPEPAVTSDPELTPEPAVTSDPEPTPEQTVTPSESTPSKSGDSSNFNKWYREENQDTTETFVLNTSTHKIHYPSCNAVKTIKPQNYATSSKSVKELEAEGYEPCGKCHPR